MKITDFLEHGRENAVRADVLAAKLETTPRGLRRQIMQRVSRARPFCTAPVDTVGTSCRAMTQRPPKRRCWPFTMSKLLDASMVSPPLRLSPAS